MNWRGAEVFDVLGFMTWNVVINRLGCLQGARRWVWIMENYKSKCLWLLYVLMEEEGAVAGNELQCDPLLRCAANLNIKVLVKHTPTHTHRAASFSLLPGPLRGSGTDEVFLASGVLTCFQLSTFRLGSCWNCDDCFILLSYRWGMLLWGFPQAELWWICVFIAHLHLWFVIFSVPNCVICYHFHAEICKRSYTMHHMFTLCDSVAHWLTQSQCYSYRQMRHGWSWQACAFQILLLLPHSHLKTLTDESACVSFGTTRRTSHTLSRRPPTWCP